MPTIIINDSFSSSRYLRIFILVPHRGVHNSKEPVRDIKSFNIFQDFKDFIKIARF